MLYDVSSSYFEGRTCPLLALGYSRDGRRGTLQIIYGLLCDQAGRPVAVEVFAGGLHDDKTLPAQIAKLRGRFGLATLVVVVDRGMVTKANLELLAAEPGARLDHRAEGAAGQEARPRGRVAAVAVRRAEPGRDRRAPTTPASGWSSAATRSSRPSAPANARTCSPRPRPSSRRSSSASSRHAGRGGRDRARGRPG